MKIRSARLPALSLALAAALSGAATAQTQNSGGSNVAPTETQSFSDWSMRCFPAASPAPCDVFLLLSDKDSHKPVVSVSMAYLADGRDVLQIMLPLGMSLAKGVTLVTAAYTSPQMPYRRCNAQGCYVEAFVDNGFVEALAAAKDSAKLSVASGNGKTAAIALSAHGFAEGWNAMKARAIARAPIGQSLKP